MLRVVSKIYTESQPFISRDAYKVICVGVHSKSSSGEQTVVSTEGEKLSYGSRAASVSADLTTSVGGGAAPLLTPQPPPPQQPRPPRRTWSAVAALSISASLGGVYLYRKYTESTDESRHPERAGLTGGETEPEPVGAVPPRAADLPAHAQYLLLGGGTAAFAAMRAIRSARPDAQVLLVSAENELPYMRPPLSKELWREPGLAERARRLDHLTFRQWNGKRRSVVYEPSAFYTAPERLKEGGAGAGVARGWTALRLDPVRHEALLRAPGPPGGPAQLHTITYDKCLIATGLRARRLEALRPAAEAGMALALRTAGDAARLAERLERVDTRTVLLVGGGFLAVELAAALAERPPPATGPALRVLLLCREPAPLAAVLPHYLAVDAARRLAAAGVTLLPKSDVVGSAVEDGRVRVRLAGGTELAADVVVECVGAEPDPELARVSGLELHDGAVLVNADLQARADIFAAGDAASFHTPELGRRRVEHHDHAVLSGRRAGENMVGDRVRPYDHHSMYWSDVGQQLGYEAIGITDSRLRTVGVFSSDAVADERLALETTDVPGEGAVGTGEEAGTARREAVAAVTGEETGPARREAVAVGTGEEAGPARRYERGVVFYLRDDRVVGVLLWNLFNRIQVARQVLSHGKFDDLFEVAKLFSPHEED